MPEVLKNNGWDIAKIGVLIAGFSLLCNLYIYRENAKKSDDTEWHKRVEEKLDKSLQTAQQLQDHISSDAMNSQLVWQKLGH